MGESRIETIVDNAGSALHGTVFKKIHAHAFVPVKDGVRINAEFLKRLSCRLPQIVARKTGNMCGWDSKMCKRYCYVGFGPGISNVKSICLGKPLVSRCGEPEHDFAKGDNFLLGH